jgi:hypothetical protein
MIGLSVGIGNQEVVRKLVRRTSIALLGISLSSCVGVRGMVVSGRCYHAPYIEFHRFRDLRKQNSRSLASEVSDWPHAYHFLPDMPTKNPRF